MSLDSWMIKDMVHTYNGILLIKKNETMLFMDLRDGHEKEWNTQMSLEIIILNEISQTEKDKYHIISLTCRILKNDKNELIYKTDTDS